MATYGRDGSTMSIQPKLAGTIYRNKDTKAQ